MSVLVTLLVYGLLVLGGRRWLALQDSRKPGPTGPTPTAPVFVFDLAALRETPPAPPSASPEDLGGAAGGLLAAPSSEAALPEMATTRTEDPEQAFPLDLVPGTPHPVSEGVRGGSGGGTGAGLGQGGQGTGTGPGAGGGAGGPAGDKPLSGLDIEVDQHIIPDYPKAALKARVEGIVTVRMEVNERGTPDRVWVVDGHPLFHESVITAFQRYRFRNLRKRGIPTPAIIEIAVWFHFPN